jgi:membrane protease YdiL (CAAX protease family)
VLGLRRPDRAVARPSRRAVRWVEAIALVAVWAALGTALRLDVNAYLLLGVPLTVVFQLGIRRRPLRDLWVKDGPAVRSAPVRKSLVGVLALVPLLLVVDGSARRNVWEALYGAVALVGAFGVGYAVSQAGRATWRSVLGCLAVAGSVGVVAFGAVGIARALGGRAGTGHGAWAATGTGIWSLLLYLPASFAIEEVTFRGAIDAHVHRPGEGGGVVDAAAVSALWGMWHLPIVGLSIGSVVALLMLHLAVGIPLSLYWRRSGNLLVPAISHAIIDAVRNVVLAL